MSTPHHEIKKHTLTTPLISISLKKIIRRTHNPINGGSLNEPRFREDENGANRMHANPTSNRS
jgi:hypothetical protein